MVKNIAIIEDDLIFQRQLINYLNNHLLKSGLDFEIVKAVADRDAAIELAMQFKIDLFLVDINLNGKETEGITLTRQLLKLNKNLKIIMLTSIENPDILSDSIKCGAISYIKKENYQSIPSEIKNAFSSFNPSLIITNNIRKLERDKILSKLNESQKRVFLCMLYGKNIRVEILAKKAFVDIGTFYNYTSKIKNILKSYDWNVLESLFQDFELAVKSGSDMQNIIIE